MSGHYREGGLSSGVAFKRGSTVVLYTAAIIHDKLLLEFHHTETQMMGLLLPLYISLLIDPTLPRSVAQQRKQIHDYVLQQVTQIGPKYPTAFRSVMQASPALKQRLEVAIRAGQSTSKDTRTQTSRSGVGQMQQQPSIKLKMDFSNFK